MARPGTRHTAGFTLLEMMVAMGIFTAVMGVLFTLSLTIGDTARIQDAQITTNDEARRALLGVIPLLRQANFESVNTDEMPGDVLRFRVAEDLDGNGIAVGPLNELELGPEIEVRRDIHDQNEDGLTTTQLILIDGEAIRVLANGLSPEGAPLPTEDDGATAANRAGFWVAEVEGGIAVTVRTEGTSRRGHVLRQEFTQIVEPRN